MAMSKNERIFGRFLNLDIFIKECIVMIKYQEVKVVKKKIDKKETRSKKAIKNKIASLEKGIDKYRTCDLMNPAIQDEIKWRRDEIKALSWAIFEPYDGREHFRHLF